LRSVDPLSEPAASAGDYIADANHGIGRAMLEMQVLHADMPGMNWALSFEPAVFDAVLRKKA
jgi:hypothetical protein